MRTEDLRWEEVTSAAAQATVHFCHSGRNSVWFSVIPLLYLWAATPQVSICINTFVTSAPILRNVNTSLSIGMQMWGQMTMHMALVLHNWLHCMSSVKNDWQYMLIEINQVWALMVPFHMCKQPLAFSFAHTDISRFCFWRNQIWRNTMCFHGDMNSQILPL